MLLWCLSGFSGCSQLGTIDCRERQVSLTTVIHTEKFFRNLIKLNWLYLPFSDWFGTKRTSVWFQINRNMVNTIWFRVDSIRFRKDFSVCAIAKHRKRSLYLYRQPFQNLYVWTGVLKRIPRYLLVKIPVETCQFIGITMTPFKSVVYVAEFFSAQEEK